MLAWQCLEDKLQREIDLLNLQDNETSLRQLQQRQLEYKRVQSELKDRFISLAIAHHNLGAELEHANKIELSKKWYRVSGGHDTGLV